MEGVSSADGSSEKSAKSAPHERRDDDPGRRREQKKKKKKKGDPPPLAPSPTRRQLELILSINTSCAAEADQGLVDV